MMPCIALIVIGILLFVVSITTPSLDTVAANLGGAFIGAGIVLWNSPWGPRRGG